MRLWLPRVLPSRSRVFLRSHWTILNQSLMNSLALMLSKKPWTAHQCLSQALFLGGEHTCPLTPAAFRVELKMSGDRCTLHGLTGGKSRHSAYSEFYGMCFHGGLSNVLSLGFRKGQPGVPSQIHMVVLLTIPVQHQGSNAHKRISVIVFVFYM